MRKIITITAVAVAALVVAVAAVILVAYGHRPDPVAATTAPSPTPTPTLSARPGARVVVFEFDGTAQRVLVTGTGRTPVVLAGYGNRDPYLWSERITPGTTVTMTATNLTDHGRVSCWIGGGRNSDKPVTQEAADAATCTFTTN